MLGSFSVDKIMTSGIFVAVVVLGLFLFTKEKIERRKARKEKLFIAAK